MMKWWGWGDPNRSFPIEDKPNFWPWVRNKLALVNEKLVPPIDRKAITLGAPVTNKPSPRRYATIK